MKIFDINEVKDLVLNSPIKEIRGYFRFNRPFNDWNFGDQDAVNPNEQLAIFEKFLNEEEIWAIFETKDGKELGKWIIKYEQFDGDPPDYSKNSLFFDVPLEDDNSLLLTLHINNGWPYYEGGGKFSISFNLE